MTIKLDAIKTRNAILTQPKRGEFNLCITEHDGTFIRYEISRNDLAEIVVNGSAMALRYQEEMS